MNSIQIECFLKAAECLSFTKAAQELYISQPTLSRNISLLEVELGFELFIRDKRQSTRLTAAGAALYTNFKENTENMQEGIERARRIDHGILTTLRIGLMEGQLIDDKLHAILHSFEEKHPSVELIPGRYNSLLDELSNDTVDLGIALYDTIENRKFLFEPLYELPVRLILHRSLLKKAKAEYSLSDFKDDYFIVNRQKEFSVFRDKQIKLCREQGFVPKCLEAPNLQTQSLWVEMGRGVVGYNPFQSVAYSPGIISVPIREYPKTIIVACWNPGNYNPAISSFVKHVRRMRPAAGIAPEE